MSIELLSPRVRLAVLKEWGVLQYEYRTHVDPLLELRVEDFEPFYREFPTRSNYEGFEDGTFVVLDRARFLGLEALPDEALQWRVRDLLSKEFGYFLARVARGTAAEENMQQLMARLLKVDESVVEAAFEHGNDTTYQPYGYVRADNVSGRLRERLHMRATTAEASAWREQYGQVLEFFRDELGLAVGSESLRAKRFVENDQDSLFEAVFAEAFRRRRLKVDGHEIVRRMGTVFAAHFASNPPAIEPLELDSGRYHAWLSGEAERYLNYKTGHAGASENEVVEAARFLDEFHANNVLGNDEAVRKAERWTNPYLYTYEPDVGGVQEFGNYEPLMSLGQLSESAESVEPVGRVERAFRRHYAATISDRRASYAPITRVVVRQLQDRKRAFDYESYDDMTKSPQVVLNRSYWQALDSLPDDALDEVIAKDVSDMATFMSLHALVSVGGNRVYYNVMARLCGMETYSNVEAVLENDRESHWWPGDVAAQRLLGWISQFSDSRTLVDIVVAATKQVIFEQKPSVLATLLHETTLYLDGDVRPAGVPLGMRDHEVERFRHLDSGVLLAAYLASGSGPMGPRDVNIREIPGSAIVAAREAIAGMKSAITSLAEREYVAERIAELEHSMSGADDVDALVSRGENPVDPALRDVIDAAVGDIARSMTRTMREVPQFVVRRLGDADEMPGDRAVRDSLHLESVERTSLGFIDDVLLKARDQLNRIVRGVQVGDNTFLPNEIVVLLNDLGDGEQPTKNYLFAQLSEQVRIQAKRLTTTLEEIRQVLDLESEGRHTDLSEKATEVRAVVQQHREKPRPRKQDDPVAVLKQALQARGRHGRDDGSSGSPARRDPTTDPTNGPGGGGVELRDDDERPAVPEAGLGKVDRGDSDNRGARSRVTAHTSQVEDPSNGPYVALAKASSLRWHAGGPGGLNTR